MVRSHVARACVGLSVDPLLTQGERNTLLGCMGCMWQRMSASPFLHETDDQTEQIHSLNSTTSKCWLQQKWQAHPELLRVGLGDAKAVTGLLDLPAQKVTSIQDTLLQACQQRQ